MRLLRRMFVIYKLFMLSCLIFTLVLKACLKYFDKFNPAHFMWIILTPRELLADWSKFIFCQVLNQSERILKLLRQNNCLIMCKFVMQHFQSFGNLYSVYERNSSQLLHSRIYFQCVLQPCIKSAHSLVSG